MKKLQNNFTTQEQSKRLLELGVPADSADCYYSNSIPHSKREDYSTLYILPFGSDSTISSLIELAEEEGGFIIPCWSVGRLMEIYITCIEHYTGDERLTVGIDTIRLGIMDCIIAAIEVGCDDGDMNFSKLEE